MATAKDNTKPLGEDSSSKLVKDLKDLEEALRGIQQRAKAKPGSSHSSSQYDDPDYLEDIIRGIQNYAISAMTDHKVTSDKKLHLKSISTTKEIKHWYDMKEWARAEHFSCRVGFIFDISKFYLVTLYQEASALQNYINAKYKEDHLEYIIPNSDVQCQMYCIFYTDGAYYRGYITKIPEVRSTWPKAVVHSIDFGHTLLVRFECLFYMKEDLYTVPKFAIRATLTGVQPYESSVWSCNAVKKFGELTIGRVLTGVVENIHAAQKILYVSLYHQDKYGYAADVSEAIVKEKLASRLGQAEGREEATKAKKAGVFLATLRFAFLFPSHQAIEDGVMPTEYIGSQNVLWPYFQHVPTSGVENISGNVAKNVADNVAENVADNVVDNVADNVAENVAENVKNIPKKANKKK